MQAWELVDFQAASRLPFYFQTFAFLWFRKIKGLKIQKVLDNPNIATLNGAFEDEKCIYLIVKYYQPGGAFLFLRSNQFSQGRKKKKQLKN